MRASLSPTQAADTHRFYPLRQTRKWNCKRCQKRYMSGLHAFLVGPFSFQPKWLLLCRSCMDWYMGEGIAELAMMKMGIRPKALEGK